MNGPFFIAMLNYQYSRAWIAYVFVPVRSNHVSAPICCILITTFLNVSILSPYICSMCLPYSLRIFPIFSLCILIFNGSTPPRFLSQPCMSKRPSGPDTAEEDFATSGAWQFEQQTWGEFQWWFLWWFHEPMMYGWFLGKRIIFGSAFERCQQRIWTCGDWTSHFIGIYWRYNGIWSGWWFQPLWQILVKWDYCSQYMEKKYSKPPTGDIC